MTTIVTSSIGSAGGRDYSNMDAWCDAAPANLVTDDKIWKGESYNDSEFTTRISIPATITDATDHYFWLTTASGQSFINNANKLTNALKYNQSNGVGLNNSSHNTRTYAGNDKNVLIENLQIKHNTSGNALVTFNNTTFKNCIFESVSSVEFCDPNKTWVEADNCVFICSASSLTYNIWIRGQKFYNCTILRPTDLTASTNCIANYYSKYPTIKNCAVLGAWTTPFAGTLGSYGAGTGYNASNDTTANMPGSNNVGSLTSSNELTDVVNTGGVDCRAKSGNSLQAGLTDSTHTNDVDIVGQTRAGTPTIGAWEFIAAAAAHFAPNLFVRQAVKRASSY